MWDVEITPPRRTGWLAVFRHLRMEHTPPRTRRSLNSPHPLTRPPSKHHSRRERERQRLVVQGVNKKAPVSKKSKKLTRISYYECSMEALFPKRTTLRTQHQPSLGLVPRRYISSFVVFLPSPGLVLSLHAHSFWNSSPVMTSERKKTSSLLLGETLPSFSPLLIIYLASSSGLGEGGGLVVPDEP
jgi:hypothetical protein